MRPLVQVPFSYRSVFREAVQTKFLSCWPTSQKLSPRGLLPASETFRLPGYYPELVECWRGNPCLNFVLAPNTTSCRAASLIQMPFQVSETGLTCMRSTIPSNVRLQIFKSNGTVMLSQTLSERGVTNLISN